VKTASRFVAKVAIRIATITAINIVAEQLQDLSQKLM
jgi:hypothetical protein